MRKNELFTAVGFIEELVRMMTEDCRYDGWGIRGIIEPKIIEGGEAILHDKHKFTRRNWDHGNFDHCYGWQQCQFEDSYYGEQLWPLNNGKYVLVWFQC